MARIPMGDFGQVIARPGPVVRPDPEAYGAGVGRALERAGSIGMQEAERDIAVQQAEAKRLQREQEAEAKAAAREAAKTKAVVARATVVNGLRDLGKEVEQGLSDGTIPKDKADEVFATRSKKLVDESVQGITDPNDQEYIRATLLDNVGAGRAGVRDMVTSRNRAEVLANGLEFNEQMGRYAARGTKEADEAIANVRAFWTSTGAKAGKDAAWIQAQTQQFAEKVRFTQATALVNTDPGAALKALKNPQYLPELDPGQRTSLIHTADSRVTQAAQRAEIKAKAHERLLEKTWDAASTVFEAGKVPAPEYAETLRRTFKGTRYEGALTAMMAAGPGAAGFASQPIPQQNAAMLQLQAKMNAGGATPQEVERYQQMEKAHRAAISDAKADPYQAAAERGVLTEVAPLTLDLKTLPQQLVRRTQDAAVVSRWSGGEVSLFRPGEADKVGGLLAAMPAKDRAASLSGLAKVMTPGQMRAFAMQLGAKDDTLAAATLLAAQNARTTAGRQVAELVLAGADAMKEQRIKWPSGMDQTTVRAEIDKLTRGAFASEVGNRAAGDAALAVFAGMLAEGKAPDVAQAVRLATGGIIERGGKKLIVPYGWSADQLEQAFRKVGEPQLSALTGGGFVSVGEKSMTPKQLAELLPSAQIGPSGKPGAYTLSIGGRMVMGPNGRPLVVPLDEGAR
jgi:hypothetical protein